VPNLINQQSSFRARVNWDKSSGYECDFFKKIAYVLSGSEKSSATTAIPEYKRHASAWLPRKDKTPNKVAFGIRGGKALVRFNGKDMVSFPVSSDKGGKVGFEFNKLVFTLDNLKITGKYDRAWCEKRLAELKKAGKLKVKEAGPEEPPIPPAPPGNS
jgi:hypothetical protein